MKIIQLSDTHLFANDEQNMFGVKSNIKFRAILDKILTEELHDTDCIFLTGDISQDITTQSYQKIVDHLSPLNIPIYWIPGNHDDIHVMQTVFNQAKNFHYLPHLQVQNWRFIFLNTKQEGSEGGFLSEAELDKLKHEIASASPDHKIVVIMHHHPIPVYTPMIDKYILKNQKEFWEIVTDTNVCLIICGHVHGDYQIEHQNIMLESAPATCLQWLKGATLLKIDQRIGYKIYVFDKNGYSAKAALW